MDDQIEQVERRNKSKNAKQQEQSATRDSGIASSVCGSSRDSVSSSAYDSMRDSLLSSSVGSVRNSAMSFSFRDSQNISQATTISEEEESVGEIDTKVNVKKSDSQKSTNSVDDRLATELHFNLTGQTSDEVPNDLTNSFERNQRSELLLAEPECINRLQLDRINKLCM